MRKTPFTHDRLTDQRTDQREKSEVVEKRLTEKQARDVVEAITWDDWIGEQRVDEVLAAIDRIWTLAHDERTEFDSDEPNAITKAEMRQLVRDVRAGAKIVVDAERKGPIRVRYEDGRVRSLTAVRMRRRRTPGAWLP